MSDARREMDRLVRSLRKAGFTVVRTGGGHWKATKDGVPGMVIMAFSPKSTGFHRTLERLRNLGYNPRG